jgi:hypothetical protein
MPNLVCNLDCIRIDMNQNLIDVHHAEARIFAVTIAIGQNVDNFRDGDWRIRLLVRV